MFIQHFPSNRSHEIKGWKLILPDIFEEWYLQWRINKGSNMKAGNIPGRQLELQNQVLSMVP